MCAKNEIGQVGFPLYDSTLTTKLILDQAGRILLPKILRRELHLGPGDTLQLESEGDEITLRPVRQRLIQKAGFKHVPKPMPMKTKNNAVIYYLYFASQKPAALNIVNSIFKKYGQR